MIYEKFFQFVEPPFNLTPDPRFYFFSKKHEEAFDHIRYGIHERKGFIVVTGEIGTGKTTLSRLLLEKLDKKVRTSMIFNPSLNTVELLQSINHDFGIIEESASKKELVEWLNQFLLNTLAKGGNALLVIDEGQNLSVECLEEIRMLSNLETEKEKLLQILLLGQPELREKLQLPGLRQLNQRIAIRYHLEPLDQNEMIAYVACRLRVAGGKDRLLFTPKALKRLYRFSGGVPRLINILCDKALLAAYTQESRVVDDAAVTRAAAELEGLPAADRPVRTTGKLGRLMHRAEKNPGPETRWFTPVGAIVIGLLLVLLAAVGWGLPVWFNIRRGIENTALPESSMPTNSAPAMATEEVRPEPIPVVKPEETGVSLPRQDQADYFDEDGVYRVVLPEETYKAAQLTLLMIWGISQNPTPDEFKGLNGDRLISAKGFSSYQFANDLKQARLFDYPCLIRGRWTHGTDETYAVLAHLTDHDATILDPLNGKSSFSLDSLKTLWEGEGTVYWKRLPGIRLPLKKDRVDPSVKTVQKALKLQGLYVGKADGILGINTERAIRFFREKYGLKDGTAFDHESYLILSRVMSVKSPRLQVRDL